MSNQSAAFNKLSKKQKAALFILSLETDVASKMMKQLSQKEIEELTQEIARIENVPETVMEQIYDDFKNMAVSRQKLIHGGISDAQKLLEKSIGSAGANDIINKMKASPKKTYFESIKKSDPKYVWKILNNEHPQTIALVLVNLGADLASQVLGEFSQEVKNDIALRMATLTSVPQSILIELEQYINTIAKEQSVENKDELNSPKIVAGMLNNCDAVISKSILSHIEEQNSTLADNLKKLMYQFSDLLKIDDRGVQRLLREVDKKDLAYALKIADDDVKQKIFSNMSERAQDLLKEELQYMGPIRLKEVEAAQIRIIDTVKQLEESGEIVIAGRGGKEEVLV